MGIQRLNDKKVRKLSELAGVEFIKAAVASDGKLAEAVTAEDVHYIVDRNTGETELATEQWHWTSCGGTQ